jgi:2-hydroxy-6-oxonona-2,4-dienedioate hydrolase
MRILIHGGVPGVTPYASGPHIWGNLEGEKVTVTGGTVDAMTESVRRVIKGKCHLVGHDLGGLIAFNLAIESPQLVSAVTAVASVAAAPTGDGVPDITLAHPPRPLWSRESQRWALERVSYSHRHIDDALLEGCVKAAARQAAADANEFVPSLMKAKSRFYEVCRSEGIRAPCQVIWGSHDPLGTFDHGLWLFRGIAQRQRAAQFHVINRAGALPFREEPEAFHHLVSAFAEGIS